MAQVRFDGPAGGLFDVVADRQRSEHDRQVSIDLSGGTYFGPVFLFCLGCLVLVVPGRFHLVRG